MKTIITLLYLMLLTTPMDVHGQTDTLSIDSNVTEFIIDSIFPQKYIIDGEVVGVLFTVEQAQRIDNDYEMYSLMDSIITQYGLNDSITIGVINAQGRKITSLELKVVNLEQMLKDKDNMLDNRDSIISELNRKIDLQEAQIKLHQDIETSYEDEKNELMKEIKRQKRQKVLGFITTGVVSVGIIILSVVK